MSKKAIPHALLALALLVSLALASPLGELPNRPPFNRPVAVTTGPEGSPLPALVRSLSKAAGVRAVIKELPEATVIADFPPRPFREVLPLLLSLYAPDYSFVLLPDDLVAIGPRADLQKLVPPSQAQANRENPAPPPQPKRLEGTATLTLDAGALATKTVEVAQSLSKNVKATYVPLANTVILSGPPEEVARVAAVLREAIEKANLHKPKKPEEPQVKAYPLPPNLDAKAVATALQAHGFKATALANPPTLFVEGDPKTQGEVRQLLDAILQGMQARQREEQDQQKRAEPEKPKALRFLAVPESFTPDPIRKVFPDLEVVLPAPGILVLKGDPKVLPEAEKYARTLAEKIAGERRRKPGDRVLKGYPIFGDPEEIRVAIEKTLAPQLPPGSSFVVLPKQKAVVLDAPYRFHAALVALLKEIDPPIPEKNAKDRPAEPAPATELRVPVSFLTADQARELLESFKLPVGVVPEPDGKALVLTGPADKVELARRYLQQADRAPAQALFQVQVLTLSKQSFDELNTNLSAVLGGLTLAFVNGETTISRLIPGDDAKNFLAALKAVTASGKAKVVLNTRLTALDGQRSKIKSGGTIVWATGGGGGNQGEEDQQGQNSPLTNLDYGIVLELTPQISFDRARTLVVDAKVQVGDLPKSGPVPNSVDIPTRELSGRFLAHEGDAIVLGGVVQTLTNNTESGVPVLKDIPLIGEAFKERRVEKREEYLLLVLSPVKVTVPEIDPELPLKTPKATSQEDAKPPHDPRQPPPPPKKATPEPALNPTPAPLTATSAIDLHTPKPLDLPREAPWYYARVVPGDHRLLVYVYGRPKSAFITVKRVYAVRGKAAAELRFEPLRPYQAPARLAILTVPLTPEVKAAQALAIVVEDELGHAWSVRAPVPATVAQP